MSHPFDIGDADAQGRKDALEGEPMMDYNTFRKYTGVRPVKGQSIPEYLANGVDTMHFAYRVYCDSYRETQEA